MILDHKLQRMFNDFKIGQLNSERPLHQTAVFKELELFFKEILYIREPLFFFFNFSSSGGGGGKILL